MNGSADVIAPVNEEGTKATILRWCKLLGDSVEKDEPLLELETDKVTVEVSSPARGTLTQILKSVDQEVTPGELLARLNIADSDSDTRIATETAKAAIPSMTAILARAVTPANAAIAATVPPSQDSARALSPSVRRLLSEHALQPDQLKGSGRNGRITAQDVTRYVDRTGPRPMRLAQPAPPGAAAASTRVAHTPMRRRIAEHMARSLTEAPHVTTLFEVDMTRVLAHRTEHAAAYEAQGAHLTLTAYFIGACARALAAIPEVNATFHHDCLELHTDANIGVGTAVGGRGLIVPVIHRSQALNLFDLARRLSQVVEAARAGKLTPDDVRGGTFTISNHGVGGSLLATPIVINQPQVAILGVGKVERRVRAVMLDGLESIGIRSMCYLKLSIDHRALDAFRANKFLTMVVKTLEQWPIDEV